MKKKLNFLYMVFLLFAANTCILSGMQDPPEWVDKFFGNLENYIDEKVSTEKKQEINDKIGDLGFSFLQSAVNNQAAENARPQAIFDAKLKVAQAKEESKLRTQEMKEQAKARTEQIKELMGSFATTFLDDKRRLAQTAGAAVVIAGGVYFFKNVLPVARKMAEEYLFTPALVDYTSMNNSWFSAGNTHIENSPELADLYFNDALQAQVNYIVSVYNRISNQGGYFPNFLFYGEPGTGKTATALAIAKASGLDFVVMSGGNVQKLLKTGKAEQRLKEVIKWACNSEHGVVFFIDEADAFLKDPNGNEMSEELYSVLNSFLNLTGTESKEISFILSTNHPNKLPKAVIDRIGAGQFIYFGLPDLHQRSQMISQFVAKYFPAASRPAFNAAITHEIAKRLDGFSGRNISYLMLSLSQQDIFTGHQLNSEKVYSLVDKAVEQSKLKNQFHTFA